MLGQRASLARHVRACRLTSLGCGLGRASWVLNSDAGTRVLSAARLVCIILTFNVSAFDVITNQHLIALLFHAKMAIAGLFFSVEQVV